MYFFIKTPFDFLTHFMFFFQIATRLLSVTPTEILPRFTFPFLSRTKAKAATHP